MECVWVPEIRPSSESLRNQEKACVGRAQSRRETVIHVAGLEKQRRREANKTGLTSHTAGRNVNWRSHYGEQYGGSLKIYQWSYHITLQSHSWTNIQKGGNSNSRRYMHPDAHSSTVHNSQDMEAS